MHLLKASYLEVTLPNNTPTVLRYKHSFDHDYCSFSYTKKNFQSKKV